MRKSQYIREKQYSLSEIFTLHDTVYYRTWSYDAHADLLLEYIFNIFPLSSV